MTYRLYTIFFFAFFAGFIFLSCNGKDKAILSPQESLKQKELLDSFSENIKYIPEDYAEVVTDTILSNGFRVHIKTFTDMEKSIINTFKTNKILIKHYYREIVSEVVVYKNDKQIFNKKIDNLFLSAHGTQFLNNEILVDELKSITTNKLHLIASQCIPQSNNCPSFNIIIDQKGNYEIKKIENDART